MLGGESDVASEGDDRATEPSDDGLATDIDAGVDGEESEARTEADGDVVADDATVPSCPVEMALVPAGPFVMGSDIGEGASDERPEHIVMLSAYCIDRTEVTASAYRNCVAAGRCEAPGCGYLGDDRPVVCVDASQLSAYCAWADKRLPTRRSGRRQHAEVATSLRLRVAEMRMSGRSPGATMLRRVLLPTSSAVLEASIPSVPGPTATARTVSTTWQAT
jgi:hypothetical protein